MTISVVSYAPINCKPHPPHLGNMPGVGRGFVRPPCSSVERDLYALPVRLDGLGLVNPCKVSHSNFKASKQLTSPLVTLIIAQ